MFFLQLHLRHLWKEILATHHHVALTPTVAQQMVLQSASVFETSMVTRMPAVDQSASSTVTARETWPASTQGVKIHARASVAVMPSVQFTTTFRHARAQLA